jgi:DHA1 family multidrug resistance protein-like MFS transporter
MPVLYPPRSAIASLLFATFLVALGYGVLLPVLPGIVAQLNTSASQSDIIWHTGFITAAYAGSALIVAPIWGRLSDGLSNSMMIVLALLLTGIATIAGAFATNLLSLYFWRFVAGVGAGAIGPATQAWLGRWDAAGDSWKTRRVVLVGLASTAGLFIGPFVGGLAATITFGLKASSEPNQQFPLLTVGFLLFAAAVVVAVTVRHPPPRRQLEIIVSGLLRRISFMLIPLAITALAIGAFEVALSFMAQGQRMSPFEIGLLFAQCTLFMFAAQAILILPRFRDRSMKPVVIPALATLAVGLIGMTFVGGIVGHIIATGLVAIGGGLLPPILAKEISVIDGGASGSASGFQFAASQAGQTAGAIFAGSIATVSDPRWIFFSVAAAVAATGVLLAQTKKWMACATTHE